MRRSAPAVFGSCGVRLLRRSALKRTSSALVHVSCAPPSPERSASEACSVRLADSTPPIAQLCCRWCVVASCRRLLPRRRRRPRQRRRLKKRRPLQKLRRQRLPRLIRRLSAPLVALPLSPSPRQVCARDRMAGRAPPLANVVAPWPKSTMLAHTRGGWGLKDGAHTTERERVRERERERDEHCDGLVGAAVLKPRHCGRF